MICELYLDKNDMSIQQRRLPDSSKTQTFVLAETSHITNI